MLEGFDCALYGNGKRAARRPRRIVVLPLLAQRAVSAGRTRLLALGQRKRRAVWRESLRRSLVCGAEKVGASPNARKSPVDAPSTEPVANPVTFAAPPVNEVALSVQFSAPTVDEFGILARFWPAIRPDFPKHAKQAPVLPVQEDFQRPPTRAVQFQMFDAPPAPRYWFLSDDETLLVQAQDDRFIFNWRQIRNGQQYPRYRTLRPQFEQRYSTFLTTAGEGKDLTPAWCEITYINHVDAPGSSDGAHGPLSRVLRALNPQPTTASLPPVEDTQLQQRFVITDEDRPIGRLYLTATPAFRNDDRAPIYVVTLITRGQPREPTTASVLDFFDRGRELIVKGFKESTTNEMHEKWGLQVAGD